MRAVLGKLKLFSFLFRFDAMYLVPLFSAASYESTTIGLSGQRVGVSYLIKFWNSEVYWI